MSHNPHDLELDKEVLQGEKGPITKKLFAPPGDSIFSGDKKSLENEDNFRRKYESAFQESKKTTYTSQKEIYNERCKLINKLYRCDLTDFESKEDLVMFIGRNLKFKAYLEHCLDVEQRTLESLIGLSDDFPLKEPLPFNRTTKLAKDLSWNKLDDGGVAFSYKNKLSFIDKGEEIKIKDSTNPDVCRMALLIAKERFVSEKNGLLLTGSDAYKENMLVVAVEMGIKITNPELEERQKELKDKAVAKRYSISVRKNIEEKNVVIKHEDSPIFELYDRKDINKDEKEIMTTQLVEQKVLEIVSRDYKHASIIPNDQEITGEVDLILAFRNRSFIVIKSKDNVYVANINPEKAKEMTNMYGSTVKICKKNNIDEIEFNVINQPDWHLADKSFMLTR